MGIDPNVFIDKDGQAYLYWSLGNIYVAKLKDNMVELASEPTIIENLPKKGLKEGPWVFERNGKYYLTFPHVENKTERLEYAMGDHPMGPFKMIGVIMDEHPSGCWTNHHSIIEINGQWYLFYHHNDYSPHFDKNRSVRVDSLFFNNDGTIRKVIPTLRGVGVTPANSEIQIDRFSRISDEGVSIDFLDTLNRFNGWKIILDKKDAWVQYNGVDFMNGKLKTIKFRYISKTGANVALKINSINNKEIRVFKLPASKNWNTHEIKFKGDVKGVNNIVVQLLDNKEVEIDWICFNRSPVPFN